MLQEKTISSKGGWIASGAVVLFALALAGFAFLQRQAIIDQVLAVQYEAPAGVAAIRDELKLTDHGALLFNASQPKLQNADEFNISCHQQKETNNPILGCYAAQRIFIYDIENKKLDGIEETTAAHELLHAVYERMSDSEREAIDAEIKKVLATVMTPSLKERLEFYRKTEPGEEYNELHAILGSEFPTLGNALERHYKKYFTSRQVVVGFYNKYNTVFEDVTTKLEEQLQTVNSLTKKTNQQVSMYNREQKSLNSAILAFNQRRYTSTSTLESDRAALEVRRSVLQANRAVIVKNIEKIKTLTIERNKLVDEYNALNQSINSSQTPLPELKDVE